MAQAIRQAQTLCLDRDLCDSGNLSEEMRHRIWWDLVCSDMYVEFVYRQLRHSNSRDLGFNLYAWIEHH